MGAVNKDTVVPVPVTEIQKMADMSGVCHAMGCFHIHHLKRQAALKTACKNRCYHVAFNVFSFYSR